jgi:hypothetical protein
MPHWYVGKAAAANRGVVYHESAHQQSTIHVQMHAAAHSCHQAETSTASITQGQSWATAPASSHHHHRRHCQSGSPPACHPRHALLISPSTVLLQDDRHRCLPGDPHRGGDPPDHQAQLPGHGHQRPASRREGGLHPGPHRSAALPAALCTLATLAAVQRPAGVASALSSEPMHCHAPRAMVSPCCYSLACGVACTEHCISPHPAGRPGPVLVDVPKDIQQQLAMPDWDQALSITAYLNRLPPQPEMAQLVPVLKALQVRPGSARQHAMVPAAPAAPAANVVETIVSSSAE